MQEAKTKMEAFEKELEKEKAEKEPKMEEGKEPDEEYKTKMAALN